MRRALLFCIGMSLAHGAAAATFQVTNLADSGAGSLRDAVAQANANPGADTITFGVTGTITLTSGLILVTEALAIQGPGAGQLTIDGNAQNRIFAIIENAAPACPALTGPADYLVSISGMTLRNGQRNVANSVGGAIYTAKSLAIDDVTFENNRARAGGAIWFGTQHAGQSLAVQNARFTGNEARDIVPGTTASNAGGAIGSAEVCPPARTMPVTMTITDSVFTGNVAQPTGFNARGGALFFNNDADVTIVRTTIDGNKALSNPANANVNGQGGGISGASQTLTIRDSTISGNEAQRSAALHLFNDSLVRQTFQERMRVLVINSTISGNRAYETSGLFVYANVEFVAENTSIVGNRSDQNRTSGINLVTGPTVPASSGNAIAPTLRLESTVVWNPLGVRDIGKDVSTMPGALAIPANNSIVGRLCNEACGAGPMTLAGTGNQVGVDPLLGPLAANGGPTQTRLPQLGSPVIGAGGNPQPPLVLHDQPVSPTGGAFSNVGQVLADGFTLAQGGVINELVWYGSAWASPPFGPMAVTIRADGGNAPGPVLWTGAVAPTLVDTGQANVFFNGQRVRTIYEFTAPIPTFHAQPGVNYFLSVQETVPGSDSFSGNFVWVPSAGSPSGFGSLDGGVTWAAMSPVAYRLVTSPPRNDQRGAGFPRTIGATTDVGATEYAYSAQCSGFTDVAGNDAFCPSVAWIKNRSVTLGCTSLTTYCPSDAVIRLHMAAFMKRLGEPLSGIAVEKSEAPGLLDFTADPVVCQTAAIPATPAPRRAVLDAVFAGLAGADSLGRANLVVSEDGGTTWSEFQLFTNRATFKPNLWHSLRVTGAHNVEAGKTVRFGLKMNRPGAGASGVTDSTCRLRVRMDNSSGFTPL